MKQFIATVMLVNGKLYESTETIDGKLSCKIINPNNGCARQGAKAIMVKKEDASFVSLSVDGKKYRPETGKKFVSRSIVNELI